MPSQALKEDSTLIFEIMELRAYAEAKRAVDRAEGEDDATEWQKEVVFGVQERLIARKSTAVKDEPKNHAADDRTENEIREKEAEAEVKANAKQRALS